MKHCKSQAPRAAVAEMASTSPDTTSMSGPGGGGIKLEDEQNTIGCMHHLAILARWAEEGRSAGSPNANNLVYNVQGGGGEEGAGPRSRMEADHRIRHLDLDFFFFFLPSLLIFSLCFRISRTKV